MVNHASDPKSRQWGSGTPSLGCSRPPPPSHCIPGTGRVVSPMYTTAVREAQRYSPRSSSSMHRRKNNPHRIGQLGPTTHTHTHTHSLPPSPVCANSRSLSSLSLSLSLFFFYYPPCLLPYLTGRAWICPTCLDLPGPCPIRVLSRSHLRVWSGLIPRLSIRPHPRPPT
ncbi:hypothetical protein LZ30DRAFT_99463 [Colletotrichum cereale]|nr:hypothetical protein LZ30DRAFT_99463 [Colletotrichum cereale]